MFWMIPAMAALGATGGAIKHRSDKKRYQEDIDQDNRNRVFAAFTGYQPKDAPEKPSAFRSIFGGGVMGANMGLGLASGIQGLQNMSSGSQINPYRTSFQPEQLTMPKFSLQNYYAGGRQ